MNILFCGNEGVFDGMFLCALSILKRTKAEDPFRFYIYTMDLTEVNASYRSINGEQVARFREMITSYNPQSELRVIDVGAWYHTYFDGCPNEGAYCSPYTLLRLLADKVEGMPDKILYLDADIFFQRDIQLLYHMNIEEYEYAAARDHYGKYLMRPNYINAGVLLMNLKRMKETGILTCAREWIRKKKLVFADQSALIRSTTAVKMLPQRFNDQKFWHRHTVVRHFSKRLFWFPYPHTDNIKQWHIEKVHRVFRYHQFDDIYDEYLCRMNAEKEAVPQ